MLIITDHVTQSISKHYVWHLGEPLPSLTGSVIVFQAGRDELQLILETLRRERDEAQNRD